MQWNLRSTTVPTDREQLLHVLLANRGIDTQDAFLHPQHPMVFSNSEVGLDDAHVRRVVERLEKARRDKEKIIIFGDYDCDGVCATAVLWETLHELGLQVFPFIPDRHMHGYGLSEKAVTELLSQGKPDILISVDNGIVAHAQWQRLRDAGVFTILTDHHEADDVTPVVDILLHTTALCGTSVAWMLARALDAKKAENLLDVVAVATIADQVPLVGANRSFAKFGLEQLNRTKRLGLRLLIEAAGLEMGHISAQGISFGIVPRINAMGRLGSALDALRALCTKNEMKARTLVLTLQDVNTERQDMTGVSIELARARASEWEHESVIVVADRSFHEGVIGLIASKLTEEFYKPSVVISIGEETSKASVRSIAGVHITHLLRSIRQEVLEVGGHPMAAGLRIQTNNIEHFKVRLQQVARESIKAELLIPSLLVDCEIPSALVELTTAASIKCMEPFGSGNREPVLLLRNLLVLDARSIGKEGKHLKLKLQYSTSNNQHQTIDAIGFGMGTTSIPVQSLIDCVGMLQVNEWKGRSSLQFLLKDIHIL